MSQIDPLSAANGIGRLLSVMHGAGPGAVGLADPFTQEQPNAPQTPTQGGSSAPSTSTGGTSGGVSGTGGFPISEQFGVNGHPGMDIATPVGTTILAPVSGTVTHAANDDPNGYGRWVEVTTPTGTVIRYGHLSGMNVTTGQQVTAGQLLGKTGGQAGADGSGNATGPHLHFEIHAQSGGPAVDPSSYLASGWQILGASGTSPDTPSVPDSSASAAAPVTPQAAADTGVAKVVTTVASSNATPDPLTQQAQGAKPKGTATGATSGADNDPNAVTSFLNAIKQHESGGDYTIRNESGLSNASGAYQFLGSTWGGYGGYQDAASAPAQVQDAKAKELALAYFNEFHSWRLAAIAWFGGPGVAEQVMKGQNPGDAPGNQGSYTAYGDTIAQMMGGGK